MWTPTARAQHSRTGLRYGSDLTGAAAREHEVGLNNRAAKAGPVVLAAEAVTAGMALLAVEEVVEAAAVLQRRAADKARPALEVSAVRSKAAEVRAAARVPAGTRGRSPA